MSLKPLRLAFVVLILNAALAPHPTHARRQTEPPKQQTNVGRARFTNVERERAMRRGMNFLYRVARDPKHFERYGSDLTWWFGATAATVKDAELRRTARRMGRECASRWRRTHRDVPEGAFADAIIDLASGDQAADSLGLRDPALKSQLRRAARGLRARDFLLFDPLSEPPPADVPEQCGNCKRQNARGDKACRHCQSALRMRSRYDVWYDALITTYIGERAGVQLGARYVEVLRWLPSMRPYRGHEGGANTDFYDSVYAVTHVVYTLNDYTVSRLSPRLLPDEFEFLKANLREAIALGDTDMLGEFMDSLKAFGLTEADPLIREGAQYLLSRQNADGSWGSLNEEDIYDRYHPTMTAINGLARYTLRREGPNFPEAKSLLERWARRGSSVSLVR